MNYLAVTCVTNNSTRRRTTGTTFCCTSNPPSSVHSAANDFTHRTISEATFYEPTRPGMSCRTPVQSARKDSWTSR